MHLLVQSIIDGFMFGAVYATVGVTFGLIYNITKVFHIAFGSIGTLGTYVAVDLAEGHAGVGAIVGAVAVGMVAAAVVTVVVTVVVYEPLRRRGADSGATFVASLGVALLVQALVILKFGPNNRAFLVDDLVLRRDVAGYGISILQVAGLVVAGGVVVGLVGLMDHTPFGHRAHALSSNREQAELVGIRTGVAAAMVCAIAGGISVIAFVVVGMSGAVVATGGTQLTLIAVLAVLAGGVGSVWGTTAAGFALGLLGGLAGALFPGQWSTTVVFVCAVAFMLARPKGLSTKGAAA